MDLAKDWPVSLLDLKASIFDKNRTAVENECQNLQQNFENKNANI